MQEQYLVSLVDPIQCLHGFLSEIATAHPTQLTGVMQAGKFYPAVNYADFMSGIIQAVFETPPSPYGLPDPQKSSYPAICTKALNEWGIPPTLHLALCREMFNLVVNAVQGLLPDMRYHDPQHHYTYDLCNECDLFFTHTHYA